MTTTGLYSFRLSFRQRRADAAEHVPLPAGDASESPSLIDSRSAAAIELLSALHGVRPERLRLICTGDAKPVAGSFSLRLALSDLSNKLLRR